MNEFKLKKQVVKNFLNVDKNLDINIERMDAAFQDCGDFVKRKFPIGEKKDVWLYICYIDMLTNADTVDVNIMSRLMLQIQNLSPNLTHIKSGLYDVLKDGGITTADLQDSDNIEDICTAIMCGDTVLFVDGAEKAVVVSTKGFPNRGVQSADTEVVVQGSKEAFSEVFRFNTALIRRRIRDTKLKVVQVRSGRRSQTDVGIMYLDDVVRKDVLNDLLARIENIDIDAVLDSGTMEQFIEDDWISPFPQAQITERPDKASTAILEGRIVIIVDNSPFVLIVPATLNTFFQSPEDYYQRWHITSLVRLIRYMAAAIAIGLPGLYIATTVYHPSMIPMMLVLKMAGARENIPFPAVVEILIMELAFELLREAGIRLPQAVGSTMGIVGGLIIGQAAVEAGLVSPIVVIVVALTGICSFAIPHVSLVSGFRIMKYMVILFSAILGLYGFWLAALLILIHLVCLKSFGIPYLYPFSSGGINGYSDFKDTLFRLPLFNIKKRPIFAEPSQSKRMGDDTGHIREKE